MTQRHFPPQRYAEPKPKGLLIAGIAIAVIGAILLLPGLGDASMIPLAMLGIGILLVFLGTRERRRLPIK
jgi:hypothetical protein